MKGNQRCNGLVSVINSNNIEKPKLFKFNSYKQKTVEHQNKEQISSITIFDRGPSFTDDSDTNFYRKPIKIEPVDQNYEDKITAHSIIGVSEDVDCKLNKLNVPTKPKLKRNNLRSAYHESLQRIDGTHVSYNHYQRHWFSSSLERFKLEDKSREERLEITRYELQRHLKQINRSSIGQVDELPTMTTETSSTVTSPVQTACYDRLIVPRNCDLEECPNRALPCTRYCTLHIMHNSDQVLFDYCTAKFADNTQCSVPVFDITHELPLCPEHARKRDNYKMYQEAKPKKLRKKVKPSAMIRPQKRNKKRKRPVSKQNDVLPVKSEDASLNSEVCEESSDLGEDMVDEVLALEEPDEMELVSVEQALATQASNLLEETDINTVLSTIQPEEFNDFFTVNRNGEYEPSREETEELERALAAVDKDVKSLEKLSQSHGLLDSFLDEHTLVESLVQIPDMFHNGYASCGDVVAQTSRLLPVEPHSHT